MTADEKKVCIAKKIVAEFESSFAKIEKNIAEEYSDVFNPTEDWEYITKALLELKKQREISSLGFYIYDIVETASAEACANLLAELGLLNSKKEENKFSETCMKYDAKQTTYI